MSLSHSVEEPKEAMIAVVIKSTEITHMFMYLHLQFYT